MGLRGARNGTMSDRFVVLSGCSGGGKSTLLAELRRRGHATVDEPGRRIVKEESADGGTALPWIDLTAFARRAIEVALADREEARDRPAGSSSIAAWWMRRPHSNMSQPSPLSSGSASCIATIRPSSSRRRGRKSSTPIPSDGMGGTKPPPSMSASHACIRSLAIVSSFSPRRASRNGPTRSWPSYRVYEVPFASTSPVRKPLRTRSRGSARCARRRTLGRTVRQLAVSTYS